MPHSDGAGVIDAVGDGVPSSRAGERVWVWNGQWQRPLGTAAEYIVLPSKLGNLLASGRPVIAGAEADTEFGRIVMDSGCGVLVEPGNAKQIASAIVSFSLERNECLRMGEEGRRYMEKNLGSRSILDGFARWTASHAVRS